MELIINPTPLLLPYFCKLPSVNQGEINERATTTLNWVRIGWGGVNDAKYDANIKAL